MLKKKREIGNETMYERVDDDCRVRNALHLSIAELGKLTNDNGPRGDFVVNLDLGIGDGLLIFVFVLPVVRQFRLQRREVSVHRPEEGSDQYLRRPSQEFARGRPKRVLRV